MKKAIVGNTIVFTFEEGVPSITFDPSRVSSQNRIAAERHGWLARLGDAAAIPRKDAKTGDIITVTEQMRYDAVAPLVAHYENSANSTWETKRAAPRIPEVEELARVTGRSYESLIEEFVKSSLAKIGA